MRFCSAEESFKETLRNDPLKDYFVWWDLISHEDCENLRAMLDSAKREEDVQQFLQANPRFLIQHLAVDTVVGSFPNKSSAQNTSPIFLSQRSTRMVTGGRQSS